MNKSKELLGKFENLAKDSAKNSENKILAMDILTILKNQAKEVSIATIQDLSLSLKENFKYVQRKYQNDYVNSILSQSLDIIDIKNDKNNYNHTINKKLFQKAIVNMGNFLNYDPLFEDKKDLEVISILTSFYHSFICFKPIHSVGMVFPGEKFKIRCVGGVYYCPTKAKQVSNPNALCSFCVCKSG